MEKKRFLERKAMAQELMLSDFEWLLSQKGRYEWARSKRLLLEWVNDVGYYIAPMMEGDGLLQHQGLYDEMMQPKTFLRLYQECFEALGMKAPRHPSSALSKLRAMEQRQGINPDTITLFYMNLLDGVEDAASGSSCRIIERFIRLR